MPEKTPDIIMKLVTVTLIHKSQIHGMLVDKVSVTMEGISLAPNPKGGVTVKKEGSKKIAVIHEAGILSTEWVPE